VRNMKTDYHCCTLLSCTMAERNSLCSEQALKTKALGYNSITPNFVTNLTTSIVAHLNTFYFYSSN
jgi:hypothetical protein